MIKFIHKKHHDELKGTARIIITYTLTDIILGFFLLFASFLVIVTLYQYQSTMYSSGVKGS